MRVLGGCWLVATLLLGCAKEPEVIVRTAEGKQLSAEVIDREPLALLPSGAVGLAYLDAPQLFASEFGPKLVALTRRLAPLPASAGFEPNRDLQRLYVGLYSMQGLDVAGVALGAFDVEAIGRAGQSAEQTPTGVPVVRSQYGGRTLYTTDNVGFVVLTGRTALFGNETGIRRMLDRIDEGRAVRAIPPWVADLLDQPNAPIAGALNLAAQPLTEGTRKNFAFLEGMHTVRFLGNFQPPGINFAGTAEYDDAGGAMQGDQRIRDSYATLQGLGAISWLVGIPQPVKRLETQVQGSEVQFVVGVDGSAVATLIDLAMRSLAAPSAGAAAGR